MPFYPAEPAKVSYGALALMHITGVGSGEGDDSYPVKPPVVSYSPNNPASQGALIRVTETWPDVRNLRMLRLKYDSTNVYKMAKMQPERFAKAINMLPVGDTTLSRIQRASQTQLIRMASYYFRKDVVGVRWVYCYNPNTGEPQERLDIVYNKSRPLLTHQGGPRHAKKENLRAS